MATGSSRSSFERAARGAAAALAAAALLSLAVPARAQTHAYVVRPGDTLIAICRDLCGDPARWRELKRLNRVADERRLRPGSTLRIPLDWLPRSPAQAVIERLNGTVEIDGRPAAAGAILVEGARLATGARSAATLRLADGSIVTVQPESVVTLERLRAIEQARAIEALLRVDRGRVDNNVPGPRGPGARFEIRTTTAVAGVRGTRYRVAETGDATLTEAVTGEVGVTGSAGGTPPVAVRAGFGVRVDAAGRTGAPIELLPAPSTAGLPALIERPVVRLPLAPVAGASGYRAQVSDDPGFRTVLLDAVQAAPELRISELADGDYWLRVRALDAAALEGLEASHAFRLKARPEPPFPSQPANAGKARGATVAFRWSQSVEADRYVLQVASDTAFTRPEIDATGLTGTEHRTPRELALGRWHWRIASVRGDADRGPWSDVQSFDLLPAPAIPEPPSIDECTLAFRWPAEPGQRFLFQLAADPGFERIVTERRLDEAQATLDRPSPGIYYMRVQATDPDGFVGPFTATQRIDVPVPPPPPPSPLWWLLLLLPLLL